MTEIELQHADDFARALDAWIDRAEKASGVALTAAGAEVARESAASFDSGDGPTNRSGTLAGSVATTEPHKGLHGYEVTVGPAGVVYARRVELGKAGDHSAGPHPYFRPGFERAGARFVEIFSAAWADAAPGR